MTRSNPADDLFMLSHVMDVTGARVRLVTHHRTFTGRPEKMRWCSKRCELWRNGRAAAPEHRCVHTRLSEPLISRDTATSCMVVARIPPASVFAFSARCPTQLRTSPCVSRGGEPLSLFRVLSLSRPSG
jgi:hypothetical protein